MIKIPARYDHVGSFLRPKYLLEARGEVEAAIRDLRSSASDDTAAREARRRVEQLAERHSSALRDIELAPQERVDRSGGEAIEVGDFVEAPALGSKPARVVELRGDDAVVELAVEVPKGFAKCLLQDTNRTINVGARCIVPSCVSHGRMTTGHDESCPYDALSLCGILHILPTHAVHDWAILLAEVVEMHE